jgi:enamine deaminase RidA (YjgF/YER057c/UK114 family)
MKQPVLVFFLILQCVQGFILQDPPMRTTSGFMTRVSASKEIKIRDLINQVEEQNATLREMREAFGKSMNSVRIINVWSPIVANAAVIFILYLSHNAVADKPPLVAMVEFRSYSLWGIGFLLLGALLQHGLQQAANAATWKNIR